MRVIKSKIKMMVSTQFCYQKKKNNISWDISIYWVTNIRYRGYQFVKHSFDQIAYKVFVPFDEVWDFYLLISQPRTVSNTFFISLVKLIIVLSFNSSFLFSLLSRCLISSHYPLLFSGITSYKFYNSASFTNITVRFGRAFLGKSMG